MRPASDVVLAAHGNDHLRDVHRAIGVVEVARGGANVVHVCPRDLFLVALHAGALALVVAHNHPTNDVIPSEEDVALTQRLRAAGDLLAIVLLDHLIIADDEAFSFTSGRRLTMTEVAESSAAMDAEPGVPLLAVARGG